MMIEQKYRWTLLVSILTLVIGVLIGSMVFSGPECEECYPVRSIEAIERTDKIIEEYKEEIKKDTYEEVEKIYHADVVELDSAWHDFARRYGK